MKRTALSIAIALMWLASRAQQPALTFALISDTHIGGQPTAGEDLQRTVDDLNARDSIAFVIISGDITEFGSDAELREAKRILDGLRADWYIVPGNHDTKWSESGCNSFRQIFGYERFAFEAGGYTFAGCGSGPNMRMAPGLAPREDLVWLDSLVGALASTRRPLIFVNHYPMDPGLANWHKIMDLLKRANTQAILCGHGHRNKPFDFEGIPGAMGRSNLRARADTGGYNLVTIIADSMYFSERRPGGTTAPPWYRLALRERDFRRDTTRYERPSYTVNEQYPGVQEVWRLQDDSDIGAGIACQGPRCFYTNTKGEVVALDLESGRRLWSFQTGGKLFTTPAVREDRLVIASTDSTVYCLRTADGTGIWRLKTGKAIVAHPVIDDDIVYIGSSEGKFRALSLADGSPLWTFEGVEGFVECRPALDEDRVYFGAWGTNFYALNKKTGAPEWTWNNGHPSRLYSPAACFPVVANDKVFIVAPDRFVTALEAETGAEVWRTNLVKGRESICLSQDESLIYIKTMQDTLAAFSTLTREAGPEWAVNCGFGYDISPTPAVEWENTIYVPTDKGVIYALDRQTRSIRWVRKLSNALINHIFPISGQEILATSMDGGVFRLRWAP